MKRYGWIPIFNNDIATVRTSKNVLLYAILFVSDMMFSLHFDLPWTSVSALRIISWLFHDFNWTFAGQKTCLSYCIMIINSTTHLTTICIFNKIKKTWQYCNLAFEQGCPTSIPWSSSLPQALSFDLRFSGPQTAGEFPLRDKDFDLPLGCLIRGHDFRGRWSLRYLAWYHG